MFNNSEDIKIFEKINNIDEECSENEQYSSAEEDNQKNDITSSSSSSDVDDENESECKEYKRIKFSEGRGIETANDGTVWQEIEGDLRKGCVRDSFEAKTGPVELARRIIKKGEVRSAFSMFIDEDIMDHVKKCTEAEATRALGAPWVLSSAKLRAFIGLLYARGAYGAETLEVSYLWNKKWGPAFFSKTMSRNNFIEIMKFVRFDEKSQRSLRLQTDKFAMISDVWNKFMKNCQKCYTPGPYLIVTEHLVSTKAKSSLIQYFRNKDNKCGIKFWLAFDSNSKYIVNGFPHLGMDEKESSLPLGEFVTLKLVDPYTGCFRNIITKDDFTSVSLASQLLEKKTTIVGSIRKSRSELPRMAKQVKDSMPRFSTKFYRSENCSLTVYKATPNKKILVLSTMHPSIEIEKNDARIPETVRFYKKSKLNEDSTDKLLKKFSVKSKSRRWPLLVFYYILDLAGFNAWILYKEATGDGISRQEFLFRLAEELASDSQEEHSKEDPPEPSILSLGSYERKMCQIRYCKKNKTNKICMKCEKYVCGKCATEKPVICKNCSRIK